MAVTSPAFVRTEWAWSQRAMMKAVTFLTAGQLSWSAFSSSMVRGLRCRSSSGGGPLCRPWSHFETNAVSAPNCLICSSIFWSKPESIPATSIITLTPRTTPNTVSALRILCARSVSMACFRFSPCACAISAALSLGPQRFDGVELRGARRRVNPEEKPYGGRHPKGQNHGVNGRTHGKGGQRPNCVNHEVGRQDSNQSAGRREHRRLGHKLQNDVLFARAERAPEPDFARALGHARQHDIHDHNAADHQEYANQRHGHKSQIAGQLVPQGHDGIR